MPLDSIASVPKVCFGAADSWDPDIYVIPQYSFAIDVGASDIKLSEEHTEYRWASYRQAAELLKWDSNRVAMWELNERLATGASGPG